MRGTALPFTILTRSHLPGLSVELGSSTENFMFFPLFQTVKSQPHPETCEVRRYPVRKHNPLSLANDQ